MENICVKTVQTTWSYAAEQKETYAYVVLLTWCIRMSLLPLCSSPGRFFSSFICHLRALKQPIFCYPCFRFTKKNDSFFVQPGYLVELRTKNSYKCKMCATAGTVGNVSVVKLEEKKIYIKC